MQSFATGLSRARIRRQSGSVAMLGALWLMIAVICLATIDIGNVFWQKRELQKIADLAALAGASGNLYADSCPVNSKINAAQNGYGLIPAATAGRWGAIKISENKYEYKFLEGNYTYNACKVQVSRSIPYFFLVSAGSTGAREISATAIAKQTKARVARVDIKSELLSLNSSKSVVLNALVNGVLGGNIDLSVVSWQGLADANISLLSYLDALVLELNLKSGNYKELLDAKVSLGKILEVMASVASRSGFLGAAVDVLNTVKASPKINDLSISLGDLLKLSSPVSDAGLNASVNLLELVTASLQVVGKNNAINLGLPVNLGPLANAALTLTVIQPPQWGIGDPAKKNEVFAKTAQIELSLTSAALFDFLKLNLDISVANGSAVVSNYDCSSARKKLYLDTEVSVIKINLSLSLLFDILKKKFPEIKIGDSVNKNLLIDNVKMVQENIEEWIQIGEEKKIIGSIVDGVISWVASLIFLPPFDDLARKFIKSITTPLTDLLDFIINGILKVLGIGIGNAYVAGRLTCGYEADLVY